MELKEELKKLDEYAGRDADKFVEQYAFLLKNFNSDEESKIITEYAENALNKISENVGKFIEETEIKVQLLKVSEIVSISYIAKNYFHKTRQWLYQKINGSLVNGKPTKFTPTEIETLNYAIQNISKQLGSTIITL
jgi:ribosome biogenesis protein Nip4